MIKQSEKDIIAKSIKAYNCSVPLVIEEMSELTKELIKHFYRGSSRRDEIIEEICDVYITLEELKIFMEISDDEVKKQIAKKIDRQIKRLAECEKPKQ